MSCKDYRTDEPAASIRHGFNRAIDTELFGRSIHSTEWDAVRL